MADSEGTRPRAAGTKKATAKMAPRRSARADTNERPNASVVGARAMQQLRELTGREVEGVTGLAKEDDGWTVQVEVVEARRIPDTTDVLALYEVEVDENAQLLGYQRVRRYVRGKPSEG
jgi:Gas vesicle synthesis protein GvpO